MIRTLLATILIAPNLAFAGPMDSGQCCFTQSYYGREAGAQPATECVTEITCSEAQKGLFVRCYFESPTEVRFEVEGVQRTPQYVRCDQAYSIDEERGMRLAACVDYPTDVATNTTGEVLAAGPNFDAQPRMLDNDALSFCDGAYDDSHNPDLRELESVFYDFWVEAGSNVYSEDSGRTYEQKKKLAQGRLKLIRDNRPAPVGKKKK